MRPEGMQGSSACRAVQERDMEKEWFRAYNDQILANICRLWNGRERMSTRSTPAAPTACSVQNKWGRGW